MNLGVFTWYNSSTDSGDGEFGKAEEQRLRDYVLQLRSERSAVRATVMELEPVHVDPFSMAPHLRYPDPSRFDLENAVLMQELMAMKVILVGVGRLYIHLYLLISPSVSDLTCY